MKLWFEQGFGGGVLSADKMVAKCIWKEYTMQCATEIKCTWCNGSHCKCIHRTQNKVHTAYCTLHIVNAFIAPHCTRLKMLALHYKIFWERGQAPSRLHLLKLWCHTNSIQISCIHCLTNSMYILYIIHCISFALVPCKFHITVFTATTKRSLWYFCFCTVIFIL